MKEIVSKVRGKSDQSTEDLYSSKFESTKWICLAIALGAIFVSDQKYFPKPDTRKGVVTALLLVIDLTFELQRTEFTTINLLKLRNVLLPNALSALLSMYLLRQTQKCANHVFNGIKLHILLHMDYLIKRFGTPQVWDTDTFESAHKDMVKQLYRQSSKRIDRIERHILSQVRG